MKDLTYEELSSMSGGKQRVDVPCPSCGPGRCAPQNRNRRVLRVWQKEPGFISYCCARCGETGWARRHVVGGAAAFERHRQFGPRVARGEDLARDHHRVGGEISPPSQAGKFADPESDDLETSRRREIARQIWNQSIALTGTMAETYFTERRGINTAEIGDLGHALRWHQGINAVVAKMSNPVTGKGNGVHRTFLNPDATKRERKMLGKQGVIKLTADADVHNGRDRRRASRPSVRMGAGLGRHVGRWNHPLPSAQRHCIAHSICRHG